MRLLVFLALLLPAWPVWADAPEVVLRGEWALDCSRPASPSNLHVRWDFPQTGRPTYRTTYGATWPNDGAVVAEVTRDDVGRMHYALEAGSRIIWRVTLVVNDDKLRVLETVDASGRILVRGGVSLMLGRPTEPIERCTDGAAPVS